MLSVGPLAAPIYFALSALLWLSFMRLVFVGLYWERVSAVEGWPWLLAFGLRMDIVSLCYMLLLPVCSLLLLPSSVTLGRIFRSLTVVYFLFLTTLLVFMECATPTYVDYFDARPGRIFYEYLVHPVEVANMLVKGFGSELVIAVLVTCISLIWIGNRMSYWMKNVDGWGTTGRRLLAFPVVIIVLVMGGRSSFDHRPVNISTVAFSNDQLVNELGLNSSYSLLHSIYTLKHESDAAGFYPWMDRHEVISRVRRMTGLKDTSFTHREIPTLHMLKASGNSQTRPNLVIVLEESLGAQFVGRLGGLPLTPELDKLAEDGIWLTNLYATGVRSARGIEAVVTGFPPSPSSAVLKLGLAQQGFFTLAAVLKRQGYRTLFVYGGESHFDNMRSFLLNNGFDSVIDQRDYQEPVFEGSWGVSDEDLFNRADEIFAEITGPFFALVFSSSFHSPFEFPDGRIDLHEGPKASRLNAVRYADYAIGHFFRLARGRDYFAKTLFMIVADHDERVRGASLVPVKNFHIPGLIIGPGVRPGIYDKVASQIDIVPTLLSLMGIETQVPVIGRDLFSVPADDPGRAVMQFGNNHAYMKGNQIVIHQPELDAVQFLYEDKALIPAQLDRELAADALAIALWPGIAYSESGYRIPAAASQL